jgi:hypothetical protein
VIFAQIVGTREDDGDQPFDLEFVGPGENVLCFLNDRLEFGFKEKQSVREDCIRFHTDVHFTSEGRHELRLTLPEAELRIVVPVFVGLKK